MSQQSTSNPTMSMPASTASASGKTLQLVYPQWQGGANPNYQIGAQVLAALLPSSPNTEKVYVPVADEKATLAANEEQTAQDVLPKRFSCNNRLRLVKFLRLNNRAKLSPSAVTALFRKYRSITCTSNIRIIRRFYGLMPIPIS